MVCFDCIVFSEVLEHLYESPIKILEELYRVIKPGGILLLTTPNVMKIENKIKFFLNKLIILMSKWIQLTIKNWMLIINPN